MFYRSVVLFAFFLVSSFAEELSFRRAIELALNNSTMAAIANADELRARQGYYEARNMYVPQAVVGSGLAYSNGFPLSIEGSAPSILSVNSQQYLLNFAGRDYMRAARTDWSAASKLKEDRRAEVIFETATVYNELDKLTGSLASLAEQEKAAARLEQVVKDRLQAGLDAEVELTRARLGLARVRMASATARGQADFSRARLSQMTGVRPESIETVTESIPRLPAPPLMEAKPQASPAVEAAQEQAVARSLRARAENRATLPSIDFAGQYALLARYNNYDEFFNKFQRHNVTAGVVMRFPFLNFAQRARAEAAAAEAVKAKKEAEAAQHEAEANTLKLRSSVEQLAAAREVAKLEYQLASSETQSVIARVEAGAATLREQENARLAENQRYSALLDASFALERAQMQLLRVTGQIEQWALGH